ncbi:MAG: FAD-dependent oxidoreductase [Thermodesulfobacteriota bacterium]|nr:FAD-dependent oxidoreductase [Thermodesulfobacteriota bacterium]
MINNTQLAERLPDNANMFRACEQCGCCSSACPLTGEGGFNVRRILRHVELGLIEEISASPFPWQCTTCGRCEGVCPNGIEILNIIRPLRAMSPPELVPEWPPCTYACPARIDIPEYLRRIAQGKPAEAYAVIREKVPFPGVLGRVCTHPCETVCRRTEVFDRPIAICSLKRYAADNAGDIPEKINHVEDDTGHKVAIIGAGPAGLTAAFYLRKKGHKVTILEERSEPGGMMRFGIPAYRLPREIIDKEIKQVLDIGIELQTEKKLGRDFSLDELKDDGYDAIFLSVGAQLSRKIDIAGADLNDVLWGVDFLCEVSEGKEISLKEKVLVVGGGNVAVDVAMTALRRGAKEVTMTCLESLEEMPANPWEIEEAREEGVKLMPSWGPKRILEDNGKVSQIELVRCTSVFDNQGNFCPSFATITETVQADQVILAIGQATDFSFLDDKNPIMAENGLIKVDYETLETTVPGVFAGGDAAKAPGTIIDAIAAGRRAAESIDRSLDGDGIIDEVLVERPDPSAYDGKREEGFADLKRSKMPALPVSERHNGFPEVELGFTEEQAIEEAKRCFQCDLELNLAQEWENQIED